MRKQTEYKYFISLILGKLALHHLKCCNQYYDLLQMREGAAAVIINEFCKIGGYGSQKPEMLNSGLLIEYLRNEKILFQNVVITDLVRAAEVEEKRIKAGI